jgi:Na+/H+ antiporter NhaD/arsenite permease-like protein
MRTPFFQFKASYGLILALTLLLATFNLSFAQTPDSVINPPTEEAQVAHSAEAPSEGHAVSHEVGDQLPVYSVLPFIGVLLSIALFPLFAPHFWEHHFPKVSLFWSLVLAVPFIWAFKGISVYNIAHVLIVDYIPFIILLWGLFTVSGGILLRGTLVGKPAVNTLLLLIATIVASWMGTTGAAMLMIRPMIRANANRKFKIHTIIFFIFLVGNIGGALTPLGDPPLFLGFLHGVPFFWTMRLLPIMSFVVIILLALFYIIDSILIKKEGLQSESHEKVPLKLEGYHNFLFLAGIVGAVLMSGSWKAGTINLWGIPEEIQNLVRDGLIILMGILSMVTTAKKTRIDNNFTWGPIREVAILFFGIFVTIIPTLAMLRAGANGALAFITNAVSEPWHYFWISGALSSFLDNAPTYLTFFNTALGNLQLPPGIVNALLSAPSLDPVHLQAAVDKLALPPSEAQALYQNLVNGGADKFIRFLTGVSAGAVFFGANSYIGNAPNFMVLSISHENHIKMPSFFGYMIWSVGILIPCFILVTFIFFL